MTLVPSIDRFPIASRLAPPTGGHTTVALGGPALPSWLVDHAGTAWGVRILTTSDGVHPLDVAGVADLIAHARTEQILRTLAHVTNLTLAGARTRVIGRDPIARTLTATLTRIGSRVTVVSDDPVRRLEAHLGGLGTATGHAPPRQASADLSILLDPGAHHGARHGVVIDATGDSHASGSRASGPAGRSGLRAADADGPWFADAPPWFPISPTDAAGPAWRIADAALALALALTSSPSPTASSSPGDLRDVARRVAEAALA